MKFNANRLGQLAGIPAQSNRALNEASNRSYHDGVANDDADYRWGKNQLNERNPYGGGKDEYKRRGGHKTGDVGGHYKDYEMEEGDHWGGGKDEYKRRGGHKTGDVGGHYKDYELEEDFLTLDTPIQEEDGSEEGDDSKTHPGEKDYTTKKGEKKKTSGKKRGTKKDDEAYVNEYGTDYLSRTQRGGAGEMADPHLDYTELEELGTLDWKGEGAEEEVDDTEKDEAPVEPMDEIMLELDENMLRREIAKMRRERQARLNESRLRSAIRNEIQGIFSELDLYRSDNKWVYGDDQPRNSRDGYVSRGFPGVGFR